MSAASDRVRPARALVVVLLVVVSAAVAGWLLGGLGPSLGARSGAGDDRTTTAPGSTNCPKAFRCLTGLYAEDLQTTLKRRGFSCETRLRGASPTCELVSQPRRVQISASTVGEVGEIERLSATVSAVRGFPLDDRAYGTLRWVAEAPLSVAPAARAQVDAWLASHEKRVATESGGSTAQIAGLRFELSGKGSGDISSATITIRAQ